LRAVFSGKPTEAATFPELIRAAAAAYGNDVAVILRGDTIPDDSLTFEEIDRRSAEIARGLIARGVGKGSRIGFIFGNSPAFVLMFAAIARIGAIAIPMSTLIKSNELVRVLRQSDVSGLIVQRKLLRNDYVERLFEALPELNENTSPELRIARVPYLRWIVSSGDSLPPNIHDIAFLTDAAATVSEELLREAESEVHTTDQMFEIYTSGSMALPKGVRHLHGPAMFRSHYLRSMINPTRGKQVNAFLPMFWIGGLMMYLLPNWESGAITMCTEGTSTNSRMAMGSVLAEEDLKKIQGPKPWWGLGMSETLGPYSYGDEFRAPGYPVCAPMDHFADGYEVRIADENDRQVGDGEVGELQIRGYPVTPGLHKVERDGYYTPDGYYRTGDMCLVDGARIHFVGRNGDMIKTASSNVSPAEVEMEMQQLEGVHSAFVVGIPDKDRGQLLVAAVVPREGVNLDLVEIETQLRKRLSSYKVPRAYLQITREQVPMLHSNKVARREIAAMIANSLGGK
jgi:acyl-CoA synthetase (AMP-forming)/AMP-acid ligase II